ncbi:hypothetical protein [Bdellovibrio bacteriovorus]|uniref:hypothetical protein n=1 Tax=Bdellovibrio TaxID=958 RepID=UPI0035A859BD
MDTFSKDQVVKTLKKTLEAHPQIQAAWLGGSTATGFEDDLSDTDIVAICEHPEVVFAEIEKALPVISSVSHIWKVDDSLWKTFFQKFYVFDEGPETYYIDVGVFQSLKPEDYQEFYNSERHGEAVVLFDKMGILKSASMSPKYEKAKVDWKNWLARFEIMYRTFLKEAERGKFIDSFLFYQRLVAMWVHLQRHYKTPQKHDFGLRYIYRDFPKEEAQLIEKYLQGADLHTLRAQALDIRNRILKIQQE